MHSRRQRDANPDANSKDDGNCKFRTEEMPQTNKLSRTKEVPQTNKSSCNMLPACTPIAQIGQTTNDVKVRCVSGPGFPSATPCGSSLCLGIILTKTTRVYQTPHLDSVQKIAYNRAISFDIHNSTELPRSLCARL